jgi:queuosine precursor transporter
MTALAIFLYAAALIAANLSAATFGAWTTPISAFLLIGLDLALRDVLHARLRWWQMGVVILGSGAASYLISSAAGRIAIAGAIAFCLAAVADWVVFARTRGTWAYRAHKSNLAGAAVDSLAFPIMAFGWFLPLIVLGQFVAKVAGAFIWVKTIEKVTNRGQA